MPLMEREGIVLRGPALNVAEERWSFKTSEWVPTMLAGAHEIGWSDPITDEAFEQMKAAHPAE